MTNEIKPLHSLFSEGRAFDFYLRGDLLVSSNKNFQAQGLAKNFSQVQRRPKILIAPCDKLSQLVFEFSADEYPDIIENHDECICVEGADKKGKKVITTFWLKTIAYYKDQLSPLDAFDREVLFHAINFYAQGYTHITISMLFDAMTGGEERRHVYKNQFDAFKRSLDKLGFTRIEVDLAELLKKMPKYKADYTGPIRVVGTILPLKYVEAEINGQKTLIIRLLDESPLATVAKIKKQYLTYDTAPLAVAGQKNTPQVIVVKNYLLRRIELMKQRKMTSTILLGTLYKDCGLTGASDSSKRNARKAIKETLDSFKADGVIKNYEFKKQRGAYESINIVY